MTSRAPRRRRRRRRLLATAVVLAAAVVAAVLYVQVGGPRASGCQVTAGQDGAWLELDQASNAATIAAVGKHRGLPDHAVTIALAAALQESKLRNIDYGDRDSLGLFQQRPSQGWGTREQVLDPRHAANEFYAHLAKVPGWQQMPVHAAVQAVQHSASGAAYQKWEDKARTLARGFTGEVPAAVACSFDSVSAAASSSSLSDAIATELGRPALDTPVSAQRGWAVASWLVAQAHRFGISAVSFAGRTWTAKSGQWSKSGGGPLVVHIRTSS